VSLFRQRHWVQIRFVKEILKVREPAVTQPRLYNVRSKPQETLLKFGDLSSAREYSMYIYSVGQMLRSVTSDEVKGRKRSAAYVVASYIAANDSKNYRSNPNFFTL